MITEKTKKRGLAAIYKLCPAVHIIAAVSAAVIALHLLLRGNRALMKVASGKLIRPLRRGLAWVTGFLPFSLAEVLIALAVLAVLVFVVVQICRIIRGPDRGSRAYTTLAVLVSAVLAVYALFCLLWGTYYYGDDFIASSGLESSEITTEQLKSVTAYFAQLANEYSTKVQRNETDVYYVNRKDILDQSPKVYLKLEKEFPCLEGPEVSAKGVFFSRVMSYIDFTGFFFPFTAEANVNTDFPPSLFAATVAHELAHQRGVAKEQEANFVAVLACFDYGDADYCYSASLLAYTHLGNALYSADYDAWLEIYSGLNAYVLKDFAANRAYWAQFETPVQQVSNTVYENFLQSYGQTLGLKSYGACVDLLVNYYYGDSIK